MVGTFGWSAIVCQHSPAFAVSFTEDGDNRERLSFNMSLRIMVT